MIGEPFHVMAGQEPDRGVAPAFRQALPDGCDGGRGGGDPRHDVPADAMGVHGVDLFVQAAKDGGVAGFQTDHLGPRLRVFDQQIVDGFLRGRGAEAFLAHVDHQRLAAGEFEDLGADQPVVDHHIGLVQSAARLEGQQFGVTGAATDKSNVTGACGAGLVVGQQRVQRVFDGGWSRGHGPRWRG